MTGGLKPGTCAAKSWFEDGAGVEVEVEVEVGVGVGVEVEVGDGVEVGVEVYFLPYASSSLTTSSSSGVDASKMSQSVIAIIRCFVPGRMW